MIGYITLSFLLAGKILFPFFYLHIIRLSAYFFLLCKWPISLMLFATFIPVQVLWLFLWIILIFHRTGSPLFFNLFKLCSLCEYIGWEWRTSGCTVMWYAFLCWWIFHSFLDTFRFIFHDPELMISDKWDIKYMLLSAKLCENDYLIWLQLLCNTQWK